MNWLSTIPCRICSLVIVVSTVFHNSLFAEWHWREPGNSKGNMAEGYRTGVVGARGQEYYFKDTSNRLQKFHRYLWKAGQVVWGSDPFGPSSTSGLPPAQANVSDWLAYHPSQVGGSDVIYYQGLDQHLWAFYQDNQYQLSSIPNIAGDIVVNTRLNIVFYRGTDDGIYAIYWEGDKWIQTPIGSLKNAGGAFAIDSNRHYIYYRGTDRRLWILFWNGSAWAQALLGSLGNVDQPVTTDSANLITYYRSWQDSSIWAVYWGGSSWIQTQLDASAWTHSSASGGAIFDSNESWGGIWNWNYTYPMSSTGGGLPPPLPPGNRMLYIDRDGRLEEEVFMGTHWGHRWIGTGVYGLTSGLSVGKETGWIFARRSDGEVIVFYWDQ